MRRIQSKLKPLVLGIAAALFALGVSQIATAQKDQPANALSTLGDNDGIFVDKASFSVIKGNGAKGNPTAILAKLGAKEVAAGAIIYRLADKLYIVDGTPPADAPPQFIKDVKDWCPTCSWYVPGSYMK